MDARTSDERGSVILLEVAIEDRAGSKMGQVGSRRTLAAEPWVPSEASPFKYVAEKFGNISDFAYITAVFPPSQLTHRRSTLLCSELTPNVLSK